MKIIDMGMCLTLTMTILSGKNKNSKGKTTWGLYVFSPSPLLPSHYTPANQVSETITLISRQLIGRFRIKEVSLYIKTGGKTVSWLK